MPPTAAILLDNLIPSAGTVDTRMGSVEHVDTGSGEPVEAIIPFINDTESFLYAATNGGIYDITIPDTPVVVNAETTYSNDRWNHANFRKADENGVIIICNGEDDAQGKVLDIPSPQTTPFSALTFTDDDLVDLPNKNFIGVTVFKGRCYYWLDNADSFWFCQAGSYQGVMKEFFLGAFVKKGGKILSITSWTQQDSGDGKDDFFVVIFNTGEIIVYQGDDPESTGFFEMVGRYVTAPPLSIRGNDQYGADTVIMTEDGYITLSTIIQQGRVSDVPAFSRLIHGAIQSRTATRAGLYGWECTLFAKQSLFLFNVPLSDTSFEQHVLNTVTERWCRFNGLNVNCMGVWEDELFGGTSDGRVLNLLSGTSDEGAPITFEAIPAFNYLGDPGNRKMITAAQVLTTHSNPGEIQLTGIADFNIPTFQDLIQPTGSVEASWSVNPPTPPQTAGSFWDTDFWAQGNQQFTTSGWQNVSAFGFAVTVSVRFSKVNESVKWRSTGLRFHLAGAQ
jgi:hypothetical protein